MKDIRKEVEMSKAVWMFMKKSLDIPEEARPVGFSSVKKKKKKKTLINIV